MLQSKITDVSAPIGLEELDSLLNVKKVTVQSTVDDAEYLKSYLSLVFDSKNHPLGNLIRILVLTFEASYTPQHPAILHIAMSEVRSVLKCIHNILRCLFFGIPKPGMSSDRSKFDHSKFDAPFSSFFFCKKKLIKGGQDDILLGPGPLILPSLLPKIYASLQGKDFNVF